jgi:hypothetical protein
LKLVKLYDGRNQAEKDLLRGTPAVPATGPSIQDCADIGTFNFLKPPLTPVAADKTQAGGTLNLTSYINACESNIAVFPNKVIEPPTVVGKTLGTDYTYDANTNIITWTNFTQPTGGPAASRRTREDNVDINLKWTKPGTPEIPATPGICGAHYNAQAKDKCLIAKWKGFTVISGGDPGSGADFGVRSLRLAQ